MHPLMQDLSQLKDTELENKIQELSKKYFQTSNPTIQNQIVVFLDMYKGEMQMRRAKMWQEQYQKRDTDLDSLININ